MSDGAPTLRKTEYTDSDICILLPFYLSDMKSGVALDHSSEFLK